MTFEIIKDAPIPPKKRGCSKYPFAEMEIGDAFDVPVGDITVAKAVSLTSSAARCFGRRHDRKFTTRYIKNDSGVSVVRCWRIA